MNILKGPKFDYTPNVILIRANIFIASTSCVINNVKPLENGLSIEFEDGNKLEMLIHKNGSVNKFTPYVKVPILTLNNSNMLIHKDIFNVINNEGKKIINEIGGYSIKAGHMEVSGFGFKMEYMFDIHDIGIG